jgi:hypothetical protein
MDEDLVAENGDLLLELLHYHAIRLHLHMESQCLNK